MALDSVLRSAILYQNAERDVTLIDIPTSIALAQGRTETLLSTAPLESPIEPREDYRPRKSNSNTNRAHESSDAAQHLEYKSIIEQALGKIRINVPGAWCAPRILQAQLPEHSDNVMDMDESEKELERHLREWAKWAESKGDDAAFDLQRMMASLGAAPELDATVQDAAAQKWTVSYRAAHEVAHEAASGKLALEIISPENQNEPWTSTFHNPEVYPLSLTISQTTSQATSQQANPCPSYKFTIPPHSTFFLSDSTHSDQFRASFRRLTATHTLPRHFDLVLLDPPWPNRSAKRKGAYEQIGGMPYLHRMLLKMDIDNYLEHNALVGVWITNKASLRDHVLGPGGLFETWNVGLVEEWVWVKTTTRGECMFDIDAAMRKPYEILLLGRAAPNAWTTMGHAKTVKRRVIAAVPDVHSRKPCLKELLEPYMADARDYTALEIFSRHLVAGWTSWGNEVLKFNWDRYWTTTTTTTLISSPNQGRSRPLQTNLAFRPV